MMKKLAMALGICALMACGAASAANGQVVSKAKSACQNNATQCAQAKSTAKADAQKEAKAAKDACAKNQAACDNAKTAKVTTVRWGIPHRTFKNMLPTVRQRDSRRANSVLLMADIAGFFAHEPASKQAVTRYRPDPWRRSLVCPIDSHSG